MNVESWKEKYKEYPMYILFLREELCAFYRIPSTRLLIESPYHKHIILFLISTSLKIGYEYVGKIMGLSPGAAQYAYSRVIRMQVQYPEFYQTLNEMLSLTKKLYDDKKKEETNKHLPCKN